MIFFLQLCVLKGCFQYNDAKPTDETPYKPGQPGAEWSSDEIDIVREKVGKARFFLVAKKLIPQNLFDLT